MELIKVGFLFKLDIARDVATGAAADFVHFCAVFKSRYIIQGIMMHSDL